MPLPTPNLDDRDFRQLLDEARQRIMQSCPEWTDLSPNDPGMVLLEVFAYLTETMLYRLNRVPEKVYIELLRLIGTRLQPPAAARTGLVFSRARAESQSIRIPRGTRVTVNRLSSASEAVVFTTIEDVVLAKDTLEARVLAYHCDSIEGELVGVGSGLAGQQIKVARPPIIAPTGDMLDLVVGVEVRPGEVDERVPAVKYGDKRYRIWREVENFANVTDDPYVYLADRMAGTILFAPAARLTREDGTLTDSSQTLAMVPGSGREIRVWYRRGGGLEGNVDAQTLTQLKDSLPGVQVTNPTPAVGGRAAETLENALIRGPQQLYSLQRAVTARDFELVALSHSQAVARAKALTRVDLWSYAIPGTVEMLLVPFVPEDERTAGAVTVTALQQFQTEDARTRVQQALDERRPLGTTCLVNWTRYKTVRVQLRIEVRREEDAQAVQQRVIERLHQTINPLPTHYSSTGWPFGQALRASHVYDVALSEPGVRWVDQVRLIVDEVPDGNVVAVATDALQAKTWYAGSAGMVYRSLNDCEGWEATGRFTGETVTLIRAHPQRAGLVAVATQVANQGGSRIRLSWTCTETWSETVYSFAFQVQDLAWIVRDNEPILFMATSAGLYELALRPGSSPLQVLVEKNNQALGFYAVVASPDVRGGTNVAVAAQGLGGIYLSNAGGANTTFRHIGLRNEDIRELVVKQEGPRSFLWAGAASSGGDDPGKGCFTWELLGAEDPPEKWQPFGKNWNGGTCRAIGFVGPVVFAATHRAGVLRLDMQNRDAGWQAADVGCGLPLRDPGRFLPVLTLTTDGANRVLAGGAKGIFVSEDGGVAYRSSSNREFSDKVTLPATWLFVSGEHVIEVVNDDAT